MEIIKNNKLYFYSVPNYIDYDYNYLCEKLAELNITRTKINNKYCLVFSDKKILTKLKKYFKTKILYNGVDDYDNSHIYTITF